MIGDYAFRQWKLAHKISVRLMDKDKKGWKVNRTGFLALALNQELVHHRNYATRNEAIREIREYIEVFYNRQRKQARLGYLSPAAYERRFYAEQKMAA